MERKLHITNFKMSKRTKLELEHIPSKVEFANDYFILIYESNDMGEPLTYVDVFEKFGKPLLRVDIGHILKGHGFEIVDLKQLKFPRLNWSERGLDVIEPCRSFILRKMIVAGHCFSKCRQVPYIMKVNLESGKADIIKILGVEDKITEMNYGPYDNGYLLVGFASGTLHVFDLVELTRLQMIDLFFAPINQIRFEPTNLIFVSTKHGEVTALSLVKKQMHYVYLKMGSKQYCTIAVPTRAKTGKLDNIDMPAKFCCV